MRLLMPMMAGLVLSACGPMSGGGTSGFHNTLEYIRINGLPKLSTLLPTLPSQFASADGVTVDSAGNPKLPQGAQSLGFSADLQALAAEARALSVQGFSESRRIEAAIQNFAGPIYNVLGKANLFTKLAGLSVTDAAELIQNGQASELDSVSQIFDQLIDTPRFAISTGGEGGMPAYLMLGAPLDQSGVEISGLYSGPKSTYNTGFKAFLSFSESNGLKVEFSFQPALLSGLIPDWKSASCDSDIWKISAVTPGLQGDGLAQLSISSLECPDERNSVSSLSFGQSDDGSWQFGAAFAQDFPDARSDSLRGWLGSRQGFVLQAVASKYLDKLSAAAAVLRESDFSDLTQEKVDQFGVGRLLADFFTAKYWNPKRESARSGSVFTNYNNLSYWACDAAIISTAIQSEVSTARELCRGQSIEVEDGIAFLKSVKKNLKQSSLVPSEVSASVGSLVDVLSVRNSIFLGDSLLSYKTAPDQEFSQIDQQRKNNAPIITEVSSTSWVSGAHALLPVIASEDLPNSAFKAITGPLKKFIKSECQELSADSAQRAKKDPETAQQKCS